MRRCLSLLLPLSALFIACTDEQPTSPAEFAGAVLASADFVVNSLADPGDGTCDASECTLREAIDAASAGAVIAFDPKLSGSIQLIDSLVVDVSLTIEGPLAPKSITLLGSSDWRVMYIQAGATVEISRLSFANGRATDGGLIFVALGAGGLSVTDATFRNGSARFKGGAVSALAPFSCTRCVFERNVVGMGGHGGGAIYSGVQLHLDYTAVRNNSGRFGGGVWSYNGVRINRSSFTGNRGGYGGGLYIDARMDMDRERDVVNTTFSGDTAGLGSAIYIVNTARLWSITVTGNTEEYLYGAAVYVAHTGYRPLRLFNSIVAGNNAPADIGGAATVPTERIQYSLIGNPGAVALVNGVNGNIVGVPAADLKLAPLAAYGATFAHRLRPGSPAIDAGIPDGSVRPIPGEWLPVPDFDEYDQNDRFRPQGTRHDMGAVEMLPLLAATIDISPGQVPNRINLKKDGVIPVAVLGSATLDASSISPYSIWFGPADATPIHDLSKSSLFADHLQDVNGDGYTDLVLHFQIGATGLTKSSVVACLVAESASAQLQGCDAVVVK